MGSMMCTYDGIETCIADILSEKHGYAGHMGDFIEAININDNRFDFTSNDPIPLRQAKRAANTLYSASHRLKFGLLGNHEYALMRFGNLAQYICDELTKKCKGKNMVVYGTYSAIVNVHDKHGLMYRMFVTHGYTLTSSAKDPIQRKANLMANLKRKLEGKNGQTVIMAMGHCHKLLLVEPDELYLKQEDGKLKGRYLKPIMGNIGYIPPEQRYYFSTGSFSRLYTDETDVDGTPVSGYAERAGYDPAELGYVKWRVEDRQIVKTEVITV
jgi:hypothetical protein